MAKHNQKRAPHARQWLLLAAGFGLTAYFAHHAIEGRYGLSAHARMTREAASLDGRIKALTAHRDRLARDVANLQDPPHPDLIEEAARRLLGYETPRALRLDTTQR